MLFQPASLRLPETKLEFVQSRTYIAPAGRLGLGWTAAGVREEQAPARADRAYVGYFYFIGRDFHVRLGEYNPAVRCLFLYISLL